MIGGVDPTAAALSGPVAYTPLGQSSYYAVSLTDMSLAGASLGYGAGDFGATVVDTGTSVLALPPAIFDSLSSAVESSAAFTNAFGGQKGWFGTTDWSRRRSAARSSTRSSRRSRSRFQRPAAGPSR